MARDAQNTYHCTKNDPEKRSATLSDGSPAVSFNAADRFSAPYGLETYARRTVERLVSAIEPNDDQGEPPLLPILNRYKPIGSTSAVDFLTTRPCVPTTKSHINQAVADTQQWEQSAAFWLEQSPLVAFYARNDHMEFTIPYEFQGISHSYTPDFVVRLTNALTLVLEIKGLEDAQDQAKHQAAQRWVAAVNHWGQLGQWDFRVCYDPYVLPQILNQVLDTVT